MMSRCAAGLFLSAGGVAEPAGADARVCDAGEAV